MAAETIARSRDCCAGDLPCALGPALAGDIVITFPNVTLIVRPPSPTRGRWLQGRWFVYPYAKCVRSHVALAIYGMINSLRRQIVTSTELRSLASFSRNVALRGSS